MQSNFISAMQRLGIFAILMLMPGALTAQVPAPGPARVLKVGVVLGMSGYASVHSHNMREGIELAKRDLEQRGWKIELSFEDDKTQAAESAAAVQKLITTGHRLFIGPAWSYLMAAASPVYRRADVLAYGPATCSEVAGGPNPHVLHGVTPASAKVSVVAEWLKSRAFRRAAILFAASAWGDVHRQVYRKAANAAGAEVVFDEHYDYGEERTALPLLMQRLKAVRPEVVLTTSAAEGSAIIVRKLEELRIGAAFLSTDDVVDAVQQKLLAPDRVRNRLYALVIPPSDEFIRHFRDVFHHDPGVYSDSAYDGVMIFATAAATTDGSPGMMGAYIREEMDYSGVSGNYRYNSDGDVAKNSYTIVALNPGN